MAKFGQSFSRQALLASTCSRQVGHFDPRRTQAAAKQTAPLGPTNAFLVPKKLVGQPHLGLPVGGAAMLPSAGQITLQISTRIGNPSKQ